MIRPAGTAADFARVHLQALHTGSEVTRWFRKEREPHVLKVTPENVLATLNRAGIKPVLMGTHGINGYRDQARATQDVDVLVPKRDVRKAVRSLEQVFPYLEVNENEAVARFLDPITQKVVIDVMKPASRAVREVFRHTVAIGDSHRIPDLEMALVSKFIAMRAPNRRRAKKTVDLGDFMNIVETNRKGIDLGKLQRLAEQAAPGAGVEIVRLIEDIDAGRSIQV